MDPFYDESDGESRDSIPEDVLFLMRGHLHELGAGSSDLGKLEKAVRDTVRPAGLLLFEL